MTPFEREPTSIEEVTSDGGPTPNSGASGVAAADSRLPRGAPSSAFLSAVAVSFTRGLLLVVTLVSGVLSAAYFGASDAKDCYLVAQSLPAILGAILLSGVYGLVLVALTEVGQGEGVAGQLRLVRRTLVQVGIVLIPLCLAATFFPRPIIVLMAPGFGRDLTDLSGRLLPFTMFTLLGTVGFAVLRALCNARHKFALPGFVSLLVGVTGIVTLVLLAGRLGIFAQALGQLLGAFFSLIVLGVAAFFLLKDPPGFTAPAHGPRPALGLWRDFLPISIGANFGQLNLLVDNAFASYLPAGSITRLGFASVIFSNAEFLTIFAVAEVAFARFTAADRRGPAALQEELGVNLRYMLLLAAPIASGCLSFGAPLARLLYERGEFGSDSTAAVARILACLAPEIVFMGYFACFWRILFARRRLWILVWTSLGAVTLNAALNALLMRPLGINGIALSTTSVAAVFALLLGTLVRRENLEVFGPGDWTFVLRVLLGAAVMGAAVFGWSAAFESLFDVGAEPARMLEVAGGLAVAAGVYAGALQLLGIRAIPDALVRLLRAATEWRRG